MLIAGSLLALSSLQGFSVLIGYVTEILGSSNSNISPIDASIGITVMLILTNLIFLSVVDRAARRVFYIWSSLATTIGLVFYAAYLYYLTKNHALDWVPIVCLSYILFVSSLGLSPVPCIIMFEIVPEKVSTLFKYFNFFNQHTQIFHNRFNQITD